MATDRRALLGATLSVAAASFSGAAVAQGVDPRMTIVERPNEIAWRPHYGYPAEAVEEAALAGASRDPGQYFVLVRWNPGYMSAPHFYDTDRLCIVLSGIWYVASGPGFEPNATVQVPAGSFVRRVAKTTHFDGVRADGKESAVIAITGIGPIHAHLVDPTKPGWRRV